MWRQVEAPTEKRTRSNTSLPAISPTKKKQKAHHEKTISADSSESEEVNSVEKVKKKTKNKAKVDSISNQVFERTGTFSSDSSKRDEVQEANKTSKKNGRGLQTMSAMAESLPNKNLKRRSLFQLTTSASDDNIDIVQAAILKTLSLNESDIVSDNLSQFKYSVGVFLRAAHGLSDSCESRDLLFEQNADYWDEETIALKYLKLKELAEENNVELVSPPIQDAHADPSHLVLDAKMVLEQAETIDKPIFLVVRTQEEVFRKLKESNIIFDANLEHRDLVALWKLEIKKNHPIRTMIKEVNLKTILHLYHSVLGLTTRNSKTKMEDRIINWCFKKFPKAPIKGLGNTIETASQKTAVVDNLVSSDEQDQSIVVAEKSRGLVIMRLESLQVKHDKTGNLTILTNTLVAYLKKKHPLHIHLKDLKNPQRIDIFKKISSPNSKNIRIAQMNAQIARYCFDKWPHSPLEEGLHSLDKKATEEVGESAPIAADREPTIVLTKEGMDTTDQEQTIVDCDNVAVANWEKHTTSCEGKPPDSPVSNLLQYINMLLLSLKKKNIQNIIKQLCFFFRVTETRGQSCQFHHYLLPVQQRKNPSIF
jgi:hypothetical protein